MTDKPTEGDYYILLAANTDYCIDTYGGNGNFSDGTNIQLYTLNKGDGQKWKVTYRDDGSMQITCYLNAKSIDVEGGTISAGTNIQMWTDNDTRAQKWDVEDTGDTVIYQNTEYTAWYIKLIEAPTFVADVSYGTIARGTNIQLWSSNGSAAQKWIFVPIDLYHSGGLYEIRNMEKTSMVLDVADGSTTNGANVHLWPSNGTNAQKWVLTDTGSGWTVRAVGAGKYLDIAGRVAKRGANVQTWEIDDEIYSSQLWAIDLMGETTVSNKKCAIVRFGAENDVEFSLDNSGNSMSYGSNIQVYDSNITNAQRWALYATSAQDPNMPTPYDLGLAKALGGPIYKLCYYKGTNGSLTTKVYPAWLAADAWATSGSNSFQWRFRTRTMGSGMSMWNSWGSWKGFDPALVTRHGNRYDVTEGINVSYSLNTTKAMQIQFEVKSCGVADLALLTSTPTSQTVEIDYMPTLSFSNPIWTSEGLVYNYTSDYTVGRVNIYPTAMIVDGENVLVGEPKLELFDDEFKMTVPLEAFGTIPNSGSTIEMRYQIGTDRVPKFDGVEYTAGLQISYAQHSDLPITYSEGLGETLTASVSDSNARMWIAIGDKLIELDRVTTEANSASFALPYPFGKEYKVYASSGNGASWKMHVDTRRGPQRAVHAWNVGSLFAVLEARKDEVLATNFDLEASSNQYELSNRPWMVTRFSGTRSGKFSAEGALVPNVTTSNYQVFERLIGKHSLYRSPTGDIVQVAVYSLHRDTTVKYTTLTVNMYLEEK